MTARAFITGVAGTGLAPAERSFLRESGPWGFLLFARNIEPPGKVPGWPDLFRAVGGREAPVLSAQEGAGARPFAPPHWPAYPPAALYGRLYDRAPTVGVKAVRLGARLIAADL